MCGIAGVVNLLNPTPIEEITLAQMLALIRHRGPDQAGLYLDDWIGMGHVRLSILDLEGGQQPICNEDGSLWIVYNGEIFNYIELRAELDTQGHRFATNTDTEVILHLYEQYGPRCLQFLNGQFAFAIWEARTQTLFLARDRLGIRPLFYTQHKGKLLFASEIKALLGYPGISAEIDPLSLDQVFTYWSTLTPSTAFRGILEVPPAHYLYAQHGNLVLNAYWHLEFPFQNIPIKRTFHDYLDEFRNLLVDATQLRLRADVPVGAYLSGGLDSSTTAAIIRNYTSNHLDTFSVTFDDAEFDESSFQLRMARYLGTAHHVVHASHARIAEVFPEVVWHSEVPILRTAPAPLYLLSQLVRESGYKVVLTGEGADEFLAGYNIFKEAKIRRFWARRPESHLRPRLLKKLYPYISDLSSTGDAYLQAFFGGRLEEVEAPDYSHAIRWNNTSHLKRFFSANLVDAIRAQSFCSPSLVYPPEFLQWHPLHRAQYLEATIFLSQYLLSSQGDRMAMAHSIEGRFPFLDYRLVEFCNDLPPELKLYGLIEKYLLKQLAREWLPEEIWQRPKQPYRAPIQKSFFGPESPEYINELLSPSQIEHSGFFNPEGVSRLVLKAGSGRPLSEIDNMALAGILSVQLLYQQFIEDFRLPDPLPLEAGMKRVVHTTLISEPAIVAN